MWRCCGLRYSVKFCFLAQFKFYKPPYAFISVYLTRYYWTAIGLCTAAFLFSLVQPIVLCSTAGNCRYLQTTNTVVLETLITALDIMADLFVTSIPVLLICMAHFTRSQTIINVSFKSLSIVALAIAATRLAVQYGSRNQRIDYVLTVFLLVVEAAVAIIMASISSYRVLVIDHLAERRMKRGNEEQRKTQKFGTRPRPTSPRDRTRLSECDSDALVDSLSELPMVRAARTVPAEEVP
ncbi:hypothetical protein K469DRAFT_550645 [Zopfia rhizophila CBS 207.26]|uniref:TRP C-terminal domain-containing protein n=1 Tax=Zopfia rhizophila CBS 207.26 TaxID=1314779 RepID=A0A6A6ERQ8_9PEZI|nr:hypothetical protein K469DRAFT_550645 [Zopfia rhizophila CBS 207.26]